MKTPHPETRPAEEAPRRAFAAPTLRRFAKLPEVTFDDIPSGIPGDGGGDDTPILV